MFALISAPTLELAAVDVQRRAAALILGQHNLAAVAPQNADGRLVSLREDGTHHAPGEQPHPVAPLPLGGEYLSASYHVGPTELRRERLDSLHPQQPKHPAPADCRTSAASLVEPHRA